MDVLCPDCEKTFPFQGEPPTAVACPHCRNSGTLATTPPPERSQWQVEAMTAGEFQHYLANGFRPATPEALAMAEGRRKARSALPDAKDGEKKPMGKGKVALIVVGSIFILAAIGNALDPDAGTNGGGGAFPTAEANGPSMSYVGIYEWSNGADEDLYFCAKTFSSTAYWDSKDTCWIVSAGGGSGWLAMQKVECRSDMDQFRATIYDMDGRLFATKSYHENICHGSDHGYKLSITASRKITMTPKY